MSFVVTSRPYPRSTLSKLLDAQVPVKPVKKPEAKPAPKKAAKKKGRSK